MKNFIKKFSVLAILLLLALTLFGCAREDKGLVVKKDVNTAEGEYSGKTVILHTNDVHGAIAGYASVADLKADYEAKGATVLLVDAGDYTNGNVYVRDSKGESAITLMEEVGYDVVTLGNHDFDYGIDSAVELLKDRSFHVISSNVRKADECVFDSEISYEIGKDLTIGFFALTTPETQTKCNPSNIKGVTFSSKEGLYDDAKAEVEFLKKNCDIVILISHLGVNQESAGNQSYDVFNNVEGIDFIIDGHSHTVMTEGDNGEKIQSTGTELENIGVIVIDNATKTIEKNELIPLEGLSQNADLLAIAENIIAGVDERLGYKIAETSVLLDGTKEHIRAFETNLGDLIADAFIWYAFNNTEIDADANNVVAVMNGGGIRADIAEGDITRADVTTVLPFGNTVTVSYISGAELLEALEASTFSTPELAGAFPHVSGMNITVDTTVPYEAGEIYPDSTYYAPAAIKRVTINDINGQPFDENATYVVVSNNFTAAGGDTYYAFKRAYNEGSYFDTAVTLDDALTDYLISELNGEVGDNYAMPQGRVTIIK